MMDFIFTNLPSIIVIAAILVWGLVMWLDYRRFKKWSRQELESYRNIEAIMDRHIAENKSEDD